MKSKSKNRPIGVPRYKFPDAYTIEELRGRYEASDVKGRIRLLREFYDNIFGPELPPEIGTLAAKDDHVEIRRWLARHGRFAAQSSQNIPITLKADSDPLVRACLFENPDFINPIDIAFDWKALFESASHMQRLAMVRNPNTPMGFVCKLLDLNNGEFKIVLSERRELALAFFTNPCLEVLAADLDRDRTEQRELTSDFLNEIAVDSYIFARYYLSQFWELASKWPPESKIPGLVYQYVPVPESTRRKVFEGCQEPILRSFILKSSTLDDKETLILGMRDSDSSCRWIACERVSHPPTELVDEIWKGDDKDALRGLVHNLSLSEETLLRLGGRLAELGDPEGTVTASQTIEELHRSERKDAGKQ